MGGSQGEGLRGADTAVPSFFSKVLVVSGSAVFRELLRLILVPHSGDVLLAKNHEESRDRLTQFSPVDVVICDVRLPDGNGFDLLDDVARVNGVRPEVILVAERGMESDAQRATQKGAVGLLLKPVSFRQIASILKQHVGRSAARSPRRRPGGRVCLLGMGSQIGTDDAAVPQLLWYARDLSTTGAFLETESPLPLGSKLDLAIEIGNIKIRVKAEVVRVQAPGWGSGGGVGVGFVSYGDSSREVLHAYVSAGGVDTY